MDATLEKQRQPHPPTAESLAEPLIPRVFEMLDYCQASSPDEVTALAEARKLVDGQGASLFNHTANLYEQMRAESAAGRFGVRTHFQFESFQRQRQDLRQLKLLAESMDQADTVGNGVADYLFKLFEQEEDTDYSAPLSEVNDDAAEVIQPLRKSSPIKNKIVGGLWAGDELLRGTIRRVGETIGRQKEKVQMALGNRAVKAAGLSLALMGSAIAAPGIMEVGEGIGQRQAIEATASAPNPEAPSDIFEGIPTKIIECEPGYAMGAIGETLSQYAERNGLTAAQVATLNNLDESFTQFNESTTCLDVAFDSQLTVQNVGNLPALAEIYGTSIEKLVAANNITDPNAVFNTGQVLNLPPGAVVPTDLATAEQPHIPKPPERPKTVEEMSETEKAERLSRAMVMLAGNDYVTSDFGMRYHPLTGVYKMHTGIDFGVFGNPIRTLRDGQVIYAGWMDGYGNTTVIDHGDGITTLYAHQTAIAVYEGKVEAGQVIGVVGQTGDVSGPHLHYEVRVNSDPSSPLSGTPVEPRYHMIKNAPAE